MRYILFVLGCFMVFGLTASNVFASTIDGTIIPTHGYAWSENFGWLNFDATLSNVHITDTAVTGYVWIKNAGWINLAPTNSGQGIANDAEGHLSGFAWGQSTGWINFTGVQIRSDGIFTGQASGTRIGRINFDCTTCIVETDWRPLSIRGGAPTPPLPPPAPPAPAPSSGGTTVPITPSPLAPTILPVSPSLHGQGTPGATVTILAFSPFSIQPTRTQIQIGQDSQFQDNLEGINTAAGMIAVYMEDQSREISQVKFYPLPVSIRNILDVIFSPTLILRRAILTRGDFLDVHGFGVPGSELELSIDEAIYSVKERVSATGEYRTLFNTAGLSVGDHTILIRQIVPGGKRSDFSLLKRFMLVGANLPHTDLNEDGLTTITDISLFLYNWSSKDTTTRNLIDLNADGSVDVRDFSVFLQTFIIH